MFCTAGCPRIRFSISSALIFSPPRLIRSFFAPLDDVVARRVQAHQSPDRVEALRA